MHINMMHKPNVIAYNQHFIIFEPNAITYNQPFFTYQYQTNKPTAEKIIENKFCTICIISLPRYALSLCVRRLLAPARAACADPG